ncbi:MAG: hypothetical protein JNK75_13085 [Betaproteobacteria bacterium]|nr:hypothetical protein [Betaproteobacteria bacterium]
MPLDLATLADQPVKRLFVNFENGSTVGMVVTLGRESANAVMDALVSKFGNPQRTEQLFQTRGGLKTTQVTLLWTHGDHRLSVMSPMSRIDEMGVTLTSASFLRRFNSEKEKKASGDL